MSYVILDTTSQFPFFEGQNNLLKNSSNSTRSDDRYVKLTVDESIIGELITIVKRQIHLQERATEQMKSEICEYGIQVVGAYDKEKNENVYFLYFIYGSTFSTDDVNEFWHIHDGGDDVFSGMIREKSKKFHIIMINGHA